MRNLLGGASSRLTTVGRFSPPCSLRPLRTSDRQHHCASTLGVRKHRVDGMACFASGAGSDRRPSAVVGAWQLCGSVPAELFRMPDSARISRCVRFHPGRKRPAQLCLSACIYAGHTVEAIKAGTRPRYHPVHLVQKHALARSLGRQDQSQVSLLHGSRRLGRHASCEARIGPSCAEHPSTFLNQRSGCGKVGHGNAIARRGG